MTMPTSGNWTCRMFCDRHRDLHRDRFHLVLRGGHVRGSGANCTVEGSYAAEAWRLTVRRGNGSVESWSGVISGAEVAGNWQDLVPQAGTRDLCSGSFCLTPELGGQLERSQHVGATQEVSLVNAGLLAKGER